MQQNNIPETDFSEFIHGCPPARCSCGRWEHDFDHMYLEIEGVGTWCSFSCLAGWLSDWAVDDAAGMLGRTITIKIKTT